MIIDIDNKWLFLKVEPKRALEEEKRLSQPLHAHIVEQNEERMRSNEEMIEEYRRITEMRVKPHPVILPAKVCSLN